MSETTVDFDAGFSKYRVIVVILVALITSIIAELLSYFVFFRNSDYLKLQDNLIKSRAKLDKLRFRDKAGIIAENSSLSSSYSSSKIKKNPKIETLERGITNLNQKISIIKMKSGILVGILFAMVIPLCNTLFGEMAICKLPFEPIKMFRLITQAGLKSASLNDAGSIFIFGQAFMAFRMAIQKAVYLDSSSSFGRI
ncbi:dbj [Cryptosporidium bovis]|uniref:dbj n=1 Tax=Cryptosporidium bovis TaxID=310047 RepID=UPI00351A8472|nr:dbj [Cryptosporidium bovis]